MLTIYHVLKTNTETNGSTFNCDKYIKDANTTAKGAGLTQDQLTSLANCIGRMAKDKRGKASENDIIKTYKNFMQKTGMI